MDIRTDKVDAGVLNIVNEYLSAVEVGGIKVDSAFVFGSQVKGTAHKWSDLDLCIISSQLSNDRHSDLVKLMNMRNGATDLIEPHPFTPVEFASTFDPLANEIRRYGVRVA